MAHRKIVRNRPSLSCSACRRRKIKCEKQRPACANCVRLGDECMYEGLEEWEKKAAAKKRKTHQLQDQHQCDHPFDALDSHDSLHDNGSPAIDPGLEAVAVGWTPPDAGLGFQWDAPTLEFGFDFDFDVPLLNSFQLDPACPLDALPNRRDISSLPDLPFEGYISTRDDGSKLFIERTFWALVSRDARIPLCWLSCAG